MIFVEQIIKCLYLKAEETDELRADKTRAATAEGSGAALEAGFAADGGCTSSSVGAARYRYYTDKTVIPSTLEDLEVEPAEGCSEDLVGCSGSGGGGGGNEVCGTAIGDGGFTVTKDSCVGFSGTGVVVKDSCVVFSATGAGVGEGLGFSSSPDEHDSDSIGSDTLMKEEHNAFMDPMHSGFHFPPHKDLDYEIEHVPVTLRCNHSLRQSHSLPELGVTKVVKQLSHADLTRRAHFRSIIYILALSLHGIFEGLALGLQSRESSVWSLCFALCLHRCVLSFQLGMDLCGARESQGTAFLCIGTFTLISALGIVAGILFSSGALLYADVTVPEAILQSLATGTILYIVFFDILFKDLQGVGDLKRVSSCFVGFSLMAIILAITTR